MAGWLPPSCAFTLHSLWVGLGQQCWEKPPRVFTERPGMPGPVPSHPLGPPMMAGHNVLPAMKCPKLTLKRPGLGWPHNPLMGCTAFSSGISKFLLSGSRPTDEVDREKQKPGGRGQPEEQLGGGSPGCRVDTPSLTPHTLTDEPAPPPPAGPRPCLQSQAHICESGCQVPAQLAGIQDSDASC